MIEPVPDSAQRFRPTLDSGLQLEVWRSQACAGNSGPSCQLKNTSLHDSPLVPDTLHPWPPAHSLHSL